MAGGQMGDQKIKICFAASSGGHLQELQMLKPLMDRYESFILTEKTGFTNLETGQKAYYLMQSNRKSISVVWKMLCNTVYSLYIFFKEKPDIVISTGVLAIIPMCLIAKLFGKKLVYIESFAKVYSGTRTGRLLYRFADRFYVQWETMLDVYPDAVCLGGIY